LKLKRKENAILPFMVYSYHTIKSNTEALFKEKGSKFFSFAFPVSEEEEIKTHLHTLRKKYFDATHHCYAYMLGPEKKLFRAVDDGEPAHSAGTPILNQIKSKGLTNVLVVVVRYFGGTKLGVGGLVHAYKQAAEEALATADKIEIEITAEVQIDFEYEAQPEIMRLIKDFNLTLTYQQYSTKGEMTLRYAIRDENKLITKLELLVSLRHPLRWKKITKATPLE
jgi:uncharacterized YigZ family protein